MRSISAVPSFPVWQVFLIFCQSLLVSQHHRLLHPLPPLKNKYLLRLTKTEVDGNEWNYFTPGFTSNTLENKRPEWKVESVLCVDRGTGAVSSQF